MRKRLIESSVLNLSTTAARGEERRKERRKKSEGRKRLQRSSSALRDYGVMKWRETGGEVIFALFILFPSSFSLSLPAFFRKSVFLEAAVGFVGDGAFDEFGGDGGLLIVLAEVFFIAQSQDLHDFLPSHLAIQNLKHFENFGGDLSGELCRLCPSTGPRLGPRLGPRVRVWFFSKRLVLQRRDGG